VSVIVIDFVMVFFFKDGQKTVIIAAKGVNLPPSKVMSCPDPIKQLSKYMQLNASTKNLD
jgi:hypothetical protein